MSYIEREALMNFVQNHVNKSVDCNDIARFPAADVAPVVHGQWRVKGNLGVCSMCGEYVKIKSHYCPLCGAKMDGGENV